MQTNSNMSYATACTLETKHFFHSTDDLEARDVHVAAHVLGAVHVQHTNKQVRVDECVGAIRTQLSTTR